MVVKVFAGLLIRHSLVTTAENRNIVVLSKRRLTVNLLKYNPVLYAAEVCRSTPEVFSEMVRFFFAKFLAQDCLRSKQTATVLITQVWLDGFITFLLSISKLKYWLVPSKTQILRELCFSLVNLFLKNKILSFIGFIKKSYVWIVK